MNSDYIGNDMKFIVNPTATGFDKTTDDWEVTLSRGRVERTWTRDQLVVDEENNFYLCFNTDDFGPGLYMLTITVHVPDTDFDDGYREEVTQLPLINVNRLKK